MGRRRVSVLICSDSNFNSTATGWPLVRDAQRRTLSLRHTGMAVTLDVGTPENVHPPDKQTVASRLALIARAEVYGEAVDHGSPEFLQATSEPNGMRVWFTHDEGLTTRGQEVGGFELAGDDHNFVPERQRSKRSGSAIRSWCRLPRSPFLASLL